MFANGEPLSLPPQFAVPGPVPSAHAVQPIPGFSPADLGLPPKFVSWRPGQYSALIQTISSDRRFVAHAMPTGGGKSVLYEAAAILLGGRSIALTSTKALQKQLTDDFSVCGLVDMRGAQNYNCPISPNITCADGKLLGCQANDCGRKAALATALKSSQVVTNYDCYLYAFAEGEGLGVYDTLVLDEGHSAVDQMCGFLEIKLDHSHYNDLYKFLSITPPYRSTMPQWKRWAFDAAPRVKTRLDDLKADTSTDIDELRQTNSLARLLVKLSEAGDDWLIQEQYGGINLFSPIWPTDFTERYLFRGIKHVLILSATLVPKSTRLLGIADADCLFLDHPYTFDPRRAPVYLFGNAKIDHKSTPETLAEQSGRIDTLIQHRQDRKGIIHSTSYVRQAEIVARSHYSHIMIAPPNSRELPQAILDFLASPPPRVLITPALTTGYDFPLSTCEYQIMVKVPFIDSRPAILKAREQSDPEYLPYLTAQTLVQTCGRAMRGPTDQCENFIMDSHANWFLGTRRRRGKYAHLFPSWFLNQVQYLDGPPQPPRPLLSTK